MHGLARSSRNAKTLNALCPRFNLARYYSVAPALKDAEENSSPARASEDASEGRVKPVKTRVLYSELPKARLTADGTPIPPLPAWDGGLEARTKPKQARGKPGVSESLSHAQPPHENNSIALDSQKTTTLPATGNAADSLANRVPAVDNTEASADAPEPSEVKAKRRRRKKVAEPEEGSLEEGHVKEKPARRRKRATASLENMADEKSSKSKSTPKRKEAKLEGLRLTRQPRNQLAVEILDNLSKFPHCILLTRVGQFYESYFDQAAELARLLNIKLTQRTWDGQRVLMCGFPLMHLDKSLKTLVQTHRRFVALCEEFPRKPTLGAVGGFDRRVVRVLTPGTLIDEPFLNQYENNYLLAVGAPGELKAEEHEEAAIPDVGLAWIDVSTGEFFAKTIPADGLRDEIVRLGPREIVLDQALEQTNTHPVRRTLEEEGCFVSYVTPSQEPAILPIAPDALEPSQDNVLPTAEPLAPPTVFSAAEAAGIKVLTTFLRTNLMDNMPQLSAPSREVDQGRMCIDAHTLKSLEIREGMREGGVTGSLLSVIKRTVTSGGTRLLTRWLCSPSTSSREINARLSLVAFFHERPHFRADLCDMLTHAEDATRIVQKFLSGRGDASDLSAIHGTVGVWAAIKDKVALERQMEAQERNGVNDDEWASLDTLIGRMNDLQQLADRIAMSLQKTAPVQIGEAEEEDVRPEEVINAQAKPDDEESSLLHGIWDKWTIKPEFSDQLTELHRTLRILFNRRNKLERDLQLNYDAPSLTLRSSRNYGMHVHLGRVKRDTSKIMESPSFVKIAESASTAAYFHREWSILGSQVIETTTSIFAAEREAFEMLRAEVNAFTSSIRRNARILDELDVTLAFANLASEMKFVRPTITDDASYHVTNGRHPTVELGLLSNGRVFTPNTVTFAPDSHLHIITGPNMAGKSTLLRQTALIAILAQVGSFVPADRATIGITDQLFSRVGAKDDLFRDRSTFMVEMLESAEILRKATPNSLVIMDEVGRGTTVKDGLAIAFSAVHHLYSINRCRAMFATHFHELADMLGHGEDASTSAYPDIGFYCTAVDETTDDHFSYSHRLRPGVNRDSHGIKVAQLAGMPAPVIAMSKAVLSALRSGGPALNQDALRELGHSLKPS